MSTHDDNKNEIESSHEILIGRLIDGEASLTDQDRFEDLADNRPELWRTLALRQRDMMTLTRQFDQATMGVDRVELHKSVIPPRRLTWTLAMSGWAAVLIVSLSWVTIVAIGNFKDGGVDVVGDQGIRMLPQVQSVELSPEELLERYKNPPGDHWRVMELATILQEMTTLEDGSLVIRTMRRFDEEFVVPANQAALLLERQEQGEEIPIDPIELNRLLPKLNERPGPSESGPS